MSPPPNVSRARTSRNCGNCRAVKRRCDQQQPQCGQCIRMREKCSGYRDEWELVFRDQTDHTVKRSKMKTARLKNAKKAASPPIQSTNVVLPSVTPNLDEIGVNYFLSNFISGGKSPLRGYLNYIPAMYNADAESPTLMTSMAAVGLVALAHSTRQRELVSRARAKYSEAIHRLNTALASPIESVKDSTLMSVISLGVFENVSDFESWVRHVHGAAALVVLRGKNQFTSRVSLLMFNQVRADLCAACIHQAKPFPKEMREMQEEASKYADFSNAFWISGVLASRCADLLWRVTKNHKVYEIPWTDFLDDSTALLRELQYVPGWLAVQDPYTTIQAPDGDPDIVYNGRFDVYQNSWSIRVWNNLRVLRIIVCEIISYLLVQILATNLDPVVRQQMRLKLHETSQILSDMGDEILGSAPQALGFVPSEPGRHPMADFPSYISVSGGCMLIWCLYTVGKSPVSTSKVRLWIIQRLQFIGTSMGIALALQLAEDVIAIEREKVLDQIS